MKKGYIFKLGRTWYCGYATEELDVFETIGNFSTWSEAMGGLVESQMEAL